MRKIATVLILISIALSTVSATKCVDDITSSIKNGTVCQNSDTACQTALNTFLTCFTNCYQTTSNDSAFDSCVKSNCSNITNDTVKGLYNKMLACFDSVLIFSALFVLFALLF
ncbi:transmembrane protein, putative (macronuclear) [Tetrahymena thermophila SB210]|uniref:Transmembrane protein, putative n=1 Tax=Tetrahymena thermophila (strain SB210) TaxID=312017 RepID=Q23BL4_TETTS|nr:transmembrane protein, putative [Tetrahymena thermophila SB210]EAR94104.1 transmembrane protein, putative [Tetrahymena thermophila SB210]|eukprot:XP_001014349.1 transmembrane protein, putative [Tetrahymena thermophila SB210]